MHAFMTRGGIENAARAGCGQDAGAPSWAAASFRVAAAFFLAFFSCDLESPPVAWIKHARLAHLRSLSYTTSVWCCNCASQAYAAQLSSGLPAGAPWPMLTSAPFTVGTSSTAVLASVAEMSSTAPFSSIMPLIQL